MCSLTGVNSPVEPPLLSVVTGGGVVVGNTVVTTSFTDEQSSHLRLKLLYASFHCESPLMFPDADVK